MSLVGVQWFKFDHIVSKVEKIYVYENVDNCIASANQTQMDREDKVICLEWNKLEKKTNLFPLFHNNENHDLFYRTVSTNRSLSGFQWARGIQKVGTKIPFMLDYDNAKDTVETVEVLSHADSIICFEWNKATSTTINQRIEILGSEDVFHKPIFTQRTLSGFQWPRGIINKGEKVPYILDYDNVNNSINAAHKTELIKDKVIGFDWDKSEHVTRNYELDVQESDDLVTMPIVLDYKTVVLEWDKLNKIKNLNWIKQLDFETKYRINPTNVYVNHSPNMVFSVHYFNQKSNTIRFRWKLLSDDYKTMVDFSEYFMPDMAMCIHFNYVEIPFGKKLILCIEDNEVMPNTQEIILPFTKELVYRLIAKRHFIRVETGYKKKNSKVMINTMETSI